MISSALRSSCRASAKLCSLASRQSQLARRSIHNLPLLANQATYEQQGIPGLYSKEGFRDVWTEYQQYLVDELSRETAETEHETRTPFGIMLNTAASQLDAPVFNFASQAHNNHLFVEALNSPLTNQTRPSPKLLEAIQKYFEDLDTLKADIIELATLPENLAPGWVFLVEGDDKSLYLTYAFQAGSPYFAGRSQAFDLNTPMSKEIEETLDSIQLDVLEKAPTYNMPLIAINCWDVAYITDFKVAGREAFIEKVWKSLNWDVINKRFYGN
ncbi:mitochondrial 37S ribosomal protein mS42 [Magnusiomyces paraingens]|uniref:Manganese/iron superoxide dismutase C-terminal domain-containing protein n=1 Tax=Magnusiomyces paraingens TaxID=2606893 RepID=A0A5E8BFK9_9ASCO|nr:uncharacterized protein SAPINGB_P002704 [Saprochaete ingens]VVT50320.1 unnamed protein product [Saprochaete ingens]